MHRTKAKIIPPVYFFGAIIVASIAHHFFPIKQFIYWPWRWLGAGLIVIGVLLAIVANIQFAKNGTPVIPFQNTTALVTDGIYRFTRNPMYLGMILCIIGICVLFGSVTPWLVLPIFVWVIVMKFVRVEEGILESQFGQRYLNFKATTRRWF